ncbi:MAG: alpha/beta hydrolase family esterase [Candidatus Planktophila sp.]
MGLATIATLPASTLSISGGSSTAGRQQMNGELSPRYQMAKLGDRFRRRQTSQQVTNEAKQFSVNVNGTERTYYLFSSRETGNGNAPLLIMLHGGGGSASSSMKVTKLGELGSAEGINVIFPEGSNLGHSYRWNTGLKTGSAIDNVNDVAFLDKIVQTYSKDNRPVFIGGLSNGGMMALRQLCSGSSRFAGAFIIAGGTSQQILDSCSPKATLPIILMHGEMDSVVPYKGGVVVRGSKREPTTPSSIRLVSHQQLLSFWRRRNGCNDQASRSAQLLALSSSDPAVSIENFYQPLGSCRQTISIVLKEGDHGWPIDVSKLSSQEKLQLRVRQRIAGSLIGKDSVNPGSLDTSGIMIRLIQRWSGGS